MKSFQGVKVTVCGISFVSGNQEEVGVRNASTPRVHGDELGRQGFHDSLGRISRKIKQAGGLLHGQLMPPGHMTPGNEKTMPLGQRVDVKDGERQLVFANDLSRRAA